MLKRIGRSLALTLIVASVASADLVSFTSSGYFSSASGNVGFSGIPAGALSHLSAENNGLVNIQLGTITFPNPSSDFSGSFSLDLEFEVAGGSVLVSYDAPFSVLSKVQGNQDSLDIYFSRATVDTEFQGAESLWQIQDLHVTRPGNPDRSFDLSADISIEALRDSSLIPAPVPESSSVALLVTTLAAIALIRSRLSR